MILSISRKMLKIICFLTVMLASPLFSQKYILNEGIAIVSEFIVSDEFAEIIKDHGSPYAIDSLYKFTVNLYENDISEALICLTFAALPYDKIPLKIPLLNIGIPIHLPAVADSLFRIKIRNLPPKCFFDSPNNDFGDKDKLSHIFGSAFISYFSRIFPITKLAGYLVEIFEAAFKVEGAFDFRDITANYYGEVFGSLIDEIDGIMPSDILKLNNLIYFKIIL